MSDQNCAHCNGAQHCYQQAMSQRMPPLEAIRTALLTGIVVGTTDLADAPACEACQQAIETIKEGIERGAAMMGDQVRQRPRPAAQAQQPGK